MELGAGRAIMLGTAAIITVAAASPAAAQQRNFDVPAQSATTAIAELARQANIQVFAARKHTRGKRANAVRGAMTVDQALDHLLEGTGLVARQSGGQTYTIVPLGGAVRIDASALALAAAETIPAIAQDQGPVADAEPEEIIVTGTNLRGVTPSSPVISVTRKAIERSGIQNTGDLVRSIPQSFGGGYNVTIGNGGALGSSQSQSYMSTANLRGLGSDATLTLVDGQRLSAADFTNSVDISLIPLAAIERVEVLADGASAIYGSDAVAGVVNFILRKRYDGVQLTADLGTSSRGDGTQQTYSMLGGKTWASGSALLNYEFSKSDEIEAGDRPFTSDAIAQTYLIPRQKRHSVFGQFAQDLASNVRVSVQGLWARREIDDNVDFGFQYQSAATIKQYGLVGSLAVDLSDDWTVELTGNSSRHSRHHVASAFGMQFPSDSRNTMHLGDIRLNGTLFDLPGGSARLAAGAGYRSEELKQSNVRGDRNARFAFGEIAVPLVSPAMGISGVEFLQVNAALRWEDYSDFGQTANPKLGIVYRPAGELTLKASWGKSFRAPSLTQIFSAGNAFLRRVPDPLSPTGTSLLLITSGGNPDLEAERARTLTLHAQYEPKWLSGARLQATWFDIDYSGRIALPVNNFALGFTDPVAAVFLTRNPSPELQAEAIAGRTLQNSSGAPYDPLTVAGLLRNQFQNFVADKVRGVDLIGQYSVALGGGNLELSGNGTWLTDKRRAAPTLEARNITGRVYSPPKFRARAGATWTRGPFSISGFLNHTAGFEDISTTPATDVDSWTTADFQIAYNGSEGLLRGLQVAASVRNAFDEEPPPLNSLLPAYTGFGFDSTNASGIGRYFSLRVTKAF